MYSIKIFIVYVKLANLHNLGKDFKVSWRKITALKINLR